jgi:hypothetical protein
MPTIEKQAYSTNLVLEAYWSCGYCSFEASRVYFVKIVDFGRICGVAFSIQHYKSDLPHKILGSIPTDIYWLISSIRYLM